MSHYATILWYLTQGGNENNELKSMTIANLYLSSQSSFL